MNANSDDLRSKPCDCGGTMEQVIGFTLRTTDKTYQPYRCGWYCKECKTYELAILRERVVEATDI